MKTRERNIRCEPACIPHELGDQYSANQVQLALEISGVFDFFIRLQETLAKIRHRPTCTHTSDRRIRGHVAPAQKFATFVDGDFFNEIFDRLASGGISGQVHESDGIASEFGQLKSQSRRLLAEKPIWHLDQNPSAIPRTLVSAYSTAMFEIAHRGEA